MADDDAALERGSGRGGGSSSSAEMRGRPALLSPSQECPLLKPVIKQLLTNDALDGGFVLLVDKVNITSFERGGERKETIRLWLSDGIMSIQCLLRHDAHHLLTSGDIRQGSLVSVDDCQLLQQPRIKGDGKVWVLLVSEMHAIASEDAGSPVYDVEHWDIPKRTPGRFFRDYGRVVNVQDTETQSTNSKVLGGVPVSAGRERESDRESVDLIPTPRTTRHTPSTLATPVTKRKIDEVADLQPLSPLNPNVPSPLHNKGRLYKRARIWDQSPEKLLKAHSEELAAVLKALQPSPSSSPSKTVPNTPVDTPKQTSPPSTQRDAPVSPSPARRQYGKRNPDASQAGTVDPAKASAVTTESAPELKDITTPLKLTPLSDVTGRRASRNKILDFLVIVSHVNPRILVRPNFPDSRELLVMDCSTRKQVHLTVFVDAHNFYPEQGTVALMRNLTTHEYGGGSLKAYHQRCVGTRWYIPETPGWEWIDESDKLRAFWLDCEEARTIPQATWWTERGQARFNR